MGLPGGVWRQSESRSSVLTSASCCGVPQCRRPLGRPVPPVPQPRRPSRPPAPRVPRCSYRRQEFSHTVGELIEVHLRRQDSIPAFLSSLTLELFSRQTVA
nr:uncharacterized protein LOC129529605 isoform X2 [Gorilla gorilla gorilla]